MCPMSCKIMMWLKGEETKPIKKTFSNYRHNAKAVDSVYQSGTGYCCLEPIDRLWLKLPRSKCMSCWIPTPGWQN